MHRPFDIAYWNNRTFRGVFYQVHPAACVAGHSNCLEPVDVGQLLRLPIMATFKKQQDLYDSSTRHCVDTQRPRRCRLELDENSIVTEKGVGIDPCTRHQI